MRVARRERTFLDGWLVEAQGVLGDDATSGRPAPGPGRFLIALGGAEGRSFRAGSAPTRICGGGALDFWSSVV
jgi:hypothetical protein